LNGSAEPTWLTSREGITSEVLPPWTPLQLTRVGQEGAIEIGCWGRNYLFSTSVFPDQAETAGRAILASPIALQAIINGRTQQWRTGPPRLEIVSAAAVSFSRTLTGEDAEIVARVRAEYDGVVRIDFSVRPRHPLRLEALTVEIPLKAQHARYLYYYPDYGRSWSEHRPRALHGEKFVSSFVPVMWLGDEERGLMWFCESDQHWASSRPESVIEVEPKGEAVILRTTLIGTPIELAAPGPQARLDFTFGLLATPMKPVREDAWDYRTFHISQGTFGVETRLRIAESALDHLAAAGVKTICFHEHWTDIEAYTHTTYGEDLRRLVAACHARGMALLLYFGFLMSDLAPEWAQWSDECLMEPRGGYEPYNYPPQPLQNALKVCYRSVWQNFLVDGIAQVMDEYGIDGVYLDGTADPWGGCANPRHGCGYLDAEGKRRVTFALFPIRETMRRIYAVVKSRRPEGQVNLHQSAFMTPAIAYSTSYWDGEHLFANTAESALARLPLDMFRTEFMGRQWGVPAEFLHSNLALSFRQACALSVLHDVPTRPVTLEQLDLQSGLWRVFDQFRRKEAEWIPYWRSGDYVRVEPSEVYVSLYRHPSNGVLAVVSNLRGEKASCKVAFDLAALALDRVSVSEPVAQEQLAARDGTLTFSLDYLDWKLLWLRPTRA